MWRLLRLCARAYHEGRPLISDEDYDYLRRRAPPLRAGGRAYTYTPGRTRLPVDMRQGAKPQTVSYIAKHFAQGAEISDKIDGVGALWYRGVLYSRGDGVHGDVIQHQMRLPRVPYPVRGEVVLPKDTPQQNLRARVAAAMHHHHRVPQGAHFVAHGGAPKAQLAAAGFRVPRWGDVDQFSGLERALERRRAASPYHLDGLVVRDGHRVVSFKTSTVDPVPAVVGSVRWKLTKAGNLFPVIELAEPVQLGEMRARTLPGYSAGWIRDRGIGPGARIEVELKSEAVPVAGRVLEPSTVAPFPHGAVWRGRQLRPPSSS